MAGLEFWIDRGGTFTDVLLRREGYPLTALKLLSNSEAYDDAASEGVRRLMAGQTDLADVENAIGSVKMGTTVATNALLELDGAKTLFLVTEGFSDALIIGDQTRPDIFALKIERPTPLQSQTLEVRERIDAQGQVLVELDTQDLGNRLTQALEDGYESVAIALVNSYANNAHERALESLCAEAGFRHITLSSRASPLIKFVPRASTAIIDAYLEPVLRSYVERVDQGLPGTQLYFMQSSGGLSDVDHFHARNAVLSGPAGGVVGMAMTARASGFDKVIGFDMGGTSTDVSRFDGHDYARTQTTDLDGRVLRAPMLGIHTVAAGGGSILSFDGERARVGPKSAGAQPGPSCYGLGGPAALTDANLVLGRIQPAWFPKVFGPTFDQALDYKAAYASLGTLAKQMGLDCAEAAAEGFLAVAVEVMADAIKKISTGEGIDPRGYALNAFGGAGGQHACKVAEALGMDTALIHPQAGLLSAYGIGLAPIRAAREASVEKTLDESTYERAKTLISGLTRQAEDAIREQNGSDINILAQARLRQVGSDTPLTVNFEGIADMKSAFANAHKRLFGFMSEDAALILDSVIVNAEGRPNSASGATALDLSSDEAPVLSQVEIFENGQWQKAEVYQLSELGVEQVVTGPALIADTNQTVLVDAGWQAQRDQTGMIVMRHHSKAYRSSQGAIDRDPVTLELYNRRFMSIAEQMGVVLERTAHSVNMKERLDFSCAVFDADGGLVANAPHMPVHLGSMAASVKAALQAHPDMSEGDAIALNAPYNGGTHLPDITVVQPVCDPEGHRLFFVAARGHHADVGGIAPGSMPPFSTSIEDEGVIFDCIVLTRDGVFQHDAVNAVLSGGPHPARRPEQNTADLKAQIAACARGARDLRALIEKDGVETVQAYMGFVQDNAEAAVKRLIGSLPSGACEVQLDTGETIRVTIQTDQQAGRAKIDFTGTTDQLKDRNFNAPSAVTRAAVLYVLRCLVDDQIPLNEGCLKPIDLIIPEPSLLSPTYPAAVVAGNVETSQLVVDALFAATGRLANSQGTMNNLTFGDDLVQYYETVCGGSGAGLSRTGTAFAGTSAVHTHMTNSRLTDPEVLELRYPVRVRTHKIRTGSCGVGTFNGGDGSHRELEFLKPMHVSLLSGRRKVAPQGLNGGEAAQPGRQWLTHPDGRIETLDANFSTTVEVGTVLTLQTPGGGAIGSPTPGSK